MHWQGHTPYRLARVYGNESFANALDRAGHGEALDPVATTLADCASGKAPGTRLDASSLGKEDRLLLTRVILWKNRLGHAKALVAAGLDPNQTDEMGMPPLHLAGWAGLTDQVAWLLSLSPDLEHVNDYGGDIVSTIIHGSENRLDTDERDHVGCLKLVLNAGATLTKGELEGAMNEEVAAFLQDWAEAHPERVSDVS